MHICICIHTIVDMRPHICMYVHMSIYMYVYTGIYINMFILLLYAYVYMYMYVYFYILVYAMLDYVHIQMYWVVISFWPGDASNRSSTVLPIVFACLINVIHVMNKSLFRRLLTCGIVAVTAVVWPAIHRNRRASLKLIEPVHWLGKEKRSPSTGMTILESTSDFVHSIPKSPLPALMYLMRIAIDSWIVLCTWSMRVTDLSKCQQLQEDAKQLKLRCGEAGSQPSIQETDELITKS